MRVKGKKGMNTEEQLSGCSAFRYDTIGRDRTADPTIDHVRQGDMSKIYCKCGNIASMDRDILKMKRLLRKETECAVCRNHRISLDLDHMNGLFDGTLDEGADSYF